jgi:hypothetical protein
VEGLITRREIEREVCLWAEKPQVLSDGLGPLNPGIPVSAPGYFDENQQNYDCRDSAGGRRNHHCGALCAAGRSNAALNTSESDNRVLRSDNALQATVITTQAFNFNRFNQVAENASRLNSLIDAGTERPSSNTGRFSDVKKPVICLFLLMSLVGCSTTRTVYVPAQCTYRER